MNALIQTEELRSQLESPNPPIVIDVRLEEDFKTAHIPRAISNCVFEVAFQKRLVTVVPDQTQPIVVYGADSESHEARVAAEKLSRAGYTKVFELRDGFATWQQTGAPVVRAEPGPTAPGIADGIRSIDVAASSVEWRGRNLLNKHYGRIGLSSGQLEFAQGQLNGGRFVIDMNSIVCSDLLGTELHDVLLDHLRTMTFSMSRAFLKPCMSSMPRER
jgi:rhodanese-related sulfurtransferase